MVAKKALLSSLFSQRGFFFNKKLTVLFIFISLSINGFAPSAVEVSKYSFIMVAATVAQQAVMQIFEKCDVSLTDIASGFCDEFFYVLGATPLAHTSGSKAEEKGSNPFNGVEGSGIKQVVYNKKINIFKDNTFSYSFGEGISFCGTNFTFVKMNSPVSKGIIILFLMFIAAILKRKELENNDIKNINIIRTEISA